MKEKDHEADTSVLEREIDREVFKLYGLTYEEALVVDPTFGEWCKRGDF